MDRPTHHLAPPPPPRPGLPGAPSGEGAPPAEMRESTLAGYSADERRFGWASALVSRQLRWHWEHEYRVEIGTLDNPGWSLEIHVEGTVLAGVPFERSRSSARKTIGCTAGSACRTGLTPLASRRGFLVWAHDGPDSEGLSPRGSARADASKSSVPLSSKSGTLSAAVRLRLSMVCRSASKW